MTTPASYTSPPALSLEGASLQRRPSRSWTQRILWTLVGAVILNWSVSLFGSASLYWEVTVLVIIAGFWGMAVVIISLLDLESYPALARWHNQAAWANAILVVILMGVWTYIQFHASPAYTTDELSFDQYAAQLVAHGLHNPYVHSMAPAGPLFRLSPDAYTYTLLGKPIVQLSYPALSFLIYVPLILLGWTNEAGASVNMMGWVVSVLLMFWLLPRSLRPAVLILSSINVYLAFAAGGVTDMLYIPLLIVAAYRWDRFELTRASYIGPVALGLAMAIKQTPWPVTVFLLCALACDTYDHGGNLGAAARRAGRYLRIALIAFLVPNLPYLIASPSAWLSGVLVPFVKELVPAGQGIVSLTLFTHLGGGSLTAYTVLLVLVAVLLLVAFVGTYPLLRPATFMLPAIAYFFAARSQTNYLISFVPVAIIGAITAGPAPPARQRLPDVANASLRLLRGRNWGIAVSAVAGLAGLAAVLAFTSSAPLALTIVGKQTTGFLGGVRTLLVRVHNNTGKLQTPGYAMQAQGGNYSSFWTISNGPETLAPHQTATVELQSPNAPADPGLTSGFAVVAFTDRPSPTVSISKQSLVSLWRTATLPQAFDKPVKIGDRVRLQVQLLDHFNGAVTRAGIPVYMSQQYYKSSGTRRGTAMINGDKPGYRHPVIAYTNAQGLATFEIVGTEANVVPITFSAHLVRNPGKFIYGPSGFTNIRFVPNGGRRQLAITSSSQNKKKAGRFSKRGSLHGQAGQG